MFFQTLRHSHTLSVDLLCEEKLLMCKWKTSELFNWSYIYSAFRINLQHCQRSRGGTLENCYLSKKMRKYRDNSILSSKIFTGM